MGDSKMFKTWVSFRFSNSAGGGVGNGLERCDEWMVGYIRTEALGLLINMSIEVIELLTAYYKTNNSENVVTLGTVILSHDYRKKIDGEFRVFGGAALAVEMDRRIVGWSMMRVTRSD